MKIEAAFGLKTPPTPKRSGWGCAGDFLATRTYMSLPLPRAETCREALMHRATHGRRMATLLGAMALMAGTACGEGGATSNTSPPATPTAFCEQFADLWRNAQLACNCGISAGDAELFRGYFEQVCTQERVEPSTAGRQRYDAAAADQCLASVGEQLAQCGEAHTNDLPASCDDVFLPNVPEGGACEQDADCLSGLECAQSVCVARATEGGSCALGQHCPQGTYCAADQTCQPRIENGQPCAGYEWYCADGLYCSSEPLVCQPLGSEGDDCQSWFHCDVELYCDIDTGTCRRPLDEGEPCDDSLPPHPCAPALYCAADMHCRPRKAIGEECDGDLSCQSESCFKGVCVPELCITGFG